MILSTYVPANPLLLRVPFDPWPSFRPTVCHSLRTHVDVFLLLQRMRPGGRFAYGQEASAEEIRKKDLMIKAQHRFEEDTEKLLRWGMRAVGTIVAYLPVR